MEADVEKTLLKPRTRVKKVSTPELLYEKIAIAAYYLAEARCFEPGYELTDWLEAEAQLSPKPKAARKYVRIKKALP